MVGMECGTGQEQNENISRAAPVSRRARRFDASEARATVKTQSAWAGVDPFQSFVAAPANASVRPFAALQDQPDERAESARKQSSGEGVDCARADDDDIEHRDAIHRSYMHETQFGTMPFSSLLIQ